MTGLIKDKRYSQLAYSLYAAHDMTYVTASCLIKRCENVIREKYIASKDEVNIATDSNKRKAHNMKSRCNKCVRDKVSNKILIKHTYSLA